MYQKKALKAAVEDSDQDGPKMKARILEVIDSIPTEELCSDVVTAGAFRERMEAAGLGDISDRIGEASMLHLDLA